MDSVDKAAGSVQSDLDLRSQEKQIKLSSELYGLRTPEAKAFQTKYF